MKTLSSNFLFLWLLLVTCALQSCKEEDLYYSTIVYAGEVTLKDNTGSFVFRSRNDVDYLSATADCIKNKVRIGLGNTIFRYGNDTIFCAEQFSLPDVKCTTDKGTITGYLPQSCTVQSEAGTGATFSVDFEADLSPSDSIIVSLRFNPLDDNAYQPAKDFYPITCYFRGERIITSSFVR